MVRSIEICGRPVTIPDAPWSRVEREAWRWQRTLKPSEWAERFRVLTEEDSDLVGPWRNSNAPYLRGMMDVPFKPGVQEATFPKAAQVGFSEAMRNVIGWVAHQEPAPMGLLLPDRDKGEQIVSRRVLPLFKRTPVLRRLLSQRAHDLKKGEIKLSNAFMLYLMWSGSPSSLASNPIKIALADETDKFAAFSGRDGDPLSLLRKRLRTYGPRARLIKGSTPTTREGVIWQEHESADFKLYYLLPCPHCGTRQRLVFESIKWANSEGIEEPIKLAQWILHHDAAWYECRKCSGRIETRDRNALLDRGRWGTCDEEEWIAGGQYDDAEQVESFPHGTRLSMHISALYARWVSFADIAAEFLRAKGRFGAMFDFRTQTCGEPFEQQLDKVSQQTISVRCQEAELPEGIVPWWTARLIAAIDTQADHFWVVIRAWGPGMRSQRVWHGRVESFTELERWLFQTPLPYEDQRAPARIVDLAVIDTGGTRTTDGEGDQVASRTMQVYKWCLDHVARVRPIKGDAQPRPGEPIRRGRGVYASSRGTRPLTIYLLDTHHFQDELVELMQMRDKREQVDRSTGEVIQIDEPMWRLNRRDDPEYNRHLANLIKIADREGAAVHQRWVPIGSGARVDYRMCEGYQIAGAYMAGVHLLPGLEDWAQQQEAELRHERRLQEQRARTFTDPHGRPYLATQR